jgi:RNA polymerase sigma factor (sigma-70 family)
MGREHDQVLHNFAVSAFVGLRRSAYLMCGDWELAEDVVHSTLAEVLVAGRRGRIDDLDACARRIMMNAFGDWRRTFRRRERLFSAADGQPGAERNPALKISVLAALRQLPPKRRAVIVLRYWDDLGVPETADILGISAAAVKGHSLHGLTALRPVFGELLPELADAAPQQASR